MDELVSVKKSDKQPLKVAQKTGILGKKRPQKQKEDKKVIDKRDSSPYSDLNDKLSELTDTERKIIAALKSGERLADDVIAETGLSTGQVLATLTLLEVKGLVRRLPGKRITLR